MAGAKVAAEGRLMTSPHPQPSNDARKNLAERAQAEAVAHERLARALRTLASTLSQRPDDDMDAIARRMVASARTALAEAVR